MDPQKASDDRPLSVPRRNDTIAARPDRQAAVKLMRDQIDKIYDDDPNETELPRNTNVPKAYQHTHSEKIAHDATSADNSGVWRNYHTQWQSYYQQYYERYYLNQIAKRQQEITGHKAEETVAQPSMVTAGEPTPQELSRDQAVSELRDNLVAKVREQGQKVRRSRHFMPVILAITVALVFGLLQYNGLILGQVKAYVSPGSINPANLIIDPTTDTKVSADPKVIIPKINVDAPVVYDVPSLDEHIVQEKLKSGVVHYPIPGASSVPGQKGNTVILGHSSNDVFDDGGYKFVFVQLDKLNKGDTFYLNYQGTRYTYSVTDKKIINPNEVGTLVLNTDKPMATLVTCTPPGTALKRLVVFAEQVSPDPDKAAATTNGQSGSNSTAIPGNSPTLLERLFGS